MPCNYKLYPTNWFTDIRPQILERAGHKCEKCGLPNYAEGWRGTDGAFYSITQIINALEKNGYDYFEHELKHLIDKEGLTKKNPTVIVLTIAHLDYNVANNDYSNLMALCQRCHNIHDIPQRKNTRETKRYGKPLF